MPNFTKLEEGALLAIFTETPELASILERQYENAVVISRENTGRGFFTTIAVHNDAPRVNGRNVFGAVTYAQIVGLSYGLGFVLFMENGRLHLLDGHAVASESTDRLNLEDLRFTITNTPFDV